MSQETPKAITVLDKEEPRTRDVTVPMWLILIMGLLFYFSGQLFLSDHAGGFNEHVYAPYESLEAVVAINPQPEGEQDIIIGREVYNKTCVACHQPNGQGKEGVAPPLAGSEWVQAPGPNRIAHIVLNGLSGPITVEGKVYNLAMPPWRDLFTDKQLAAVLTYIRDPKTFGNKASPVKPEVIAAARKEVHPGPETAAELQQMSDQ